MQSQFQRDIAVQQAVISKTYHIMALQGKLLALTEDLEFFRKENNELRDKNEKLNKQVRKSDGHCSPTILLPSLKSVWDLVYSGQNRDVRKNFQDM